MGKRDFTRFVLKLIFGRTSYITEFAKVKVTNQSAGRDVM